MRQTVMLAVLPILASGCARPAPSNIAAATPSPAALAATATINQVTAVPPAPDTAAKAPVAASADALMPYVGQLPWDEVGGVTFLGQPLVRAAIDEAAGDPAVRRFVLHSDGPSSAIKLRDGRLLAWGCEVHNCGPHSWTLLIAPDGGDAEICYHDDAASPATRWFAGGREEDRTDDCPESD